MITQGDFNIWWKEAQEYFPDNDSMKEGYLIALMELAQRLNLEIPQ